VQWVRRPLQAIRAAREPPARHCLGLAPGSLTFPRWSASTGVVTVPTLARIGQLLSA
jgi:hypothetical protein